MGLAPHPSPYSAATLPFPLLDAWEHLEAVPLRGSYVMSPGLVFLPLTTRGRHPPSSWTHLPKLLTPVTHHTLSCSTLSRSLYSLLTPHSVWLNCMCCCVLLHTLVYALEDTSTALCSVVSRSVLFLPVGLFVIIKLHFPAFGPRLLFFLGAPLPHRDNLDLNV